MKIYAVADLHGSQHRLNLVLKNIQIHNPDLVVVCGDITPVSYTHLTLPTN